MEKRCIWQLVIYFTLHCFLAPTIESYSSELDTSKVVAQFNPYSYILNSENDGVFNVDVLDPLIAKVATRFKKIMIELDLKGRLRDGEFILPETMDSNFLSAVAAAKYNCHPSTKDKIKVILYFNNFCYVSWDCFKLLKQPFEHFADRVNKICNGTVTTIMVPRHQFRHYCNLPDMMSCTTTELSATNKNDLRLNRYKWGVVTSFQNYCNHTIHSANIYWDPAVVLIEYDNYDEMQIDVTQCKSYMESFSKPVEFIKKIHWKKIQKDYKINMSNLVTSWQIRISKLPKDSYIFIDAFDYFGQNGGWWFLDYDPANTNTSGFVFREMIQVASEVDSEEDYKNFDWLKEPIIFNVNSTGILNKPRAFASNVGQGGFCRIIIYEQVHGLQTLYNNLSLHNNKCVSNRKVIYFSSLESDIDFNTNLIDYNVTLLVDCTKGVMSLSYRYNINMMKCFRNLQYFKNSGAEYGYLFSIDVCIDYIRFDQKTQAILFEWLRDSNSTMNVFYYIEGKFNFRRSARNAFIRRITYFEHCKKLLLKSGNNISEIGFAMKCYYRRDDFHKSPSELQGYVKYVKMMNKWAGEQVNAVFYLGPSRDGKERDGIPVVGWFTLDNSQKGFTTKQQDALKLSEFHYPEPIYPNITRVEIETAVGLNTSQIVVVVCVAMAVCLVVIICSTYYVRLYYRNGEPSKEEIDMFFIGNDMSDLNADRVPYDQDKYEIADKEFSFDKGEPLGCGEFGMVFSGTVKTEAGKVNVAVKTTNLNTRHKTTLKGLLSEIKVLAYLGKHVNIIELLGANTSSLKDGNVFIFLELCQLGSLEKYLRRKRSNEGFSTEYTNINSSNFGKGCIASPNKSVSDDLYRWSMEICNGMAYLAEKHVVHADLATRNILLNLNREAKICDFGLSRRMYNYTNYVKTGQEPLPWKWMAPEALRHMKFSQKTDVWSFGVTLWEIYSLGSSPYPGLSWDLNFPQMLERGFRLSEPEYVERDMYQFMQNCWKTDPEKRPTFLDLFSMMSGTDSE